MRTAKLLVSNEEVIRLYAKLKSCKKVAQIALENKNATTMRRKLIELGVVIQERIKPKKFLISDKEIKERYLNGESLNQIAKDAQTTKGLMALRRKLHTLGVDTNVPLARYREKYSKIFKKYQLDDTVFDVIDTEEKAYWFGFLCADGYNHVSKSCVVLRLQGADKEILEKFKDFLKTNSPIYHFNRVTKINKLHKEYVELNVCSVKLSKQLESLGCVQGKSYTLEFPNSVPEHLYRHFIRGYFDGDGCISIRKRNDRKRKTSMVYQFTITGRKEFLEVVNNILTQNTGINKLQLKSLPRTFAQALHYGGRNVVMKLLDYIYKDSSIYLQRKYLKYQQLNNCISAE